MDVLTLVMVIILSWALVRFAILTTKLVNEYRTITNRLDDIDKEIGILHGRVYELNHEIENLKEKR